MKLFDYLCGKNFHLDYYTISKAIHNIFIPQILPKQT